MEINLPVSSEPIVAEGILTNDYDNPGEVDDVLIALKPGKYGFTELEFQIDLGSAAYTLALSPEMSLRLADSIQAQYAPFDRGKFPDGTYVEIRWGSDVYGKPEGGKGDWIPAKVIGRADPIYQWRVVLEDHAGIERGENDIRIPGEPDPLEPPLPF